MIRLILLFSLPLAAQGTLGIYCPLTSSKPVVCSVNSATALATTLQWNITTNNPNIGMTAVSLDPNKSAGVNGSQMIMVGMNAARMIVGTVATVTIKFPSTFSCPGNSPCLTVTLSAAQATINNHAVNLSASPASATVRVKK